MRTVRQSVSKLLRSRGRPLSSSSSYIKACEQETGWTIQRLGAALGAQIENLDLGTPLTTYPSLTTTDSTLGAIYTSKESTREQNHERKI